MRILHVNNWHRGVGGSDAACRFVIEMCRRRGLHVDVFSRDSKLLAGGMAGKLQAFAGCVYARSAVRDFERSLQQLKPDVVHVHELFPLISPWILPCCTAAGIPVVMTCYDFRLTCPIATHHNQGANCYKCAGGNEHQAFLNNCRNSLPESFAYALRSGLASRLRHFSDHVTRFIVLSEFSRRWIEDRAQIPSDRVATIPCIIPTPETGVDDPYEGAYVAYAGRFAAEKGIEIVVAACRKAGVPLRLAGDAMSHPSIEAGDDAVCVETGTPGSLTRFYRGARLLVVASRWEETFAIVLSEAKSHGIPVIAPRIGAMPDLVEHNVTGLLFETGDVDDLAEKIKELWHDAVLCRRLGAAGRANVQAELNETLNFERLLAVYQDVAAAKERRSASGSRMSAAISGP